MKDSTVASAHDFCFENEIGVGAGDGSLLFGYNFDIGYKRYIIGVYVKGGKKSALSYVPDGYSPPFHASDPTDFYARPSELSSCVGYRVYENGKSNFIISAGPTWHRQQVFYYTGDNHSPHDLYTGICNKSGGLRINLESCRQFSGHAAISLLFFYSIYNGRSAAGLMVNFRFGALRMR